MAKSIERKVVALIAKTQPGPTTATARPAMAGPIRRAELNAAELSETALVRSRRGTISPTNDCRAGMSKAVATPRPRENTYINNKSR